MHQCSVQQLFFFMNRSTPDYLIWLKYLSWFSYGNEMLVVNQWEDVKNISTYNIKHFKVVPLPLKVRSLGFW